MTIRLNELHFSERKLVYRPATNTSGGLRCLSSMERISGIQKYVFDLCTISKYYEATEWNTAVQTESTDPVKCLNVILKSLRMSTFLFLPSPPPALPSPDGITTVPLTFCLRKQFLLLPNCSAHVLKQLV